MKEEQFIRYPAPTVAITEITVECGFALSGWFSPLSEDNDYI